MVDDTTDTADEQTTQEEHHEEPQKAPDEAPLNDGGMKALRAERDARKAAEQSAMDVTKRLDAVLAALGQGNKDDVDPDKLAQDLQARDQELAQARAQLAVMRAADGVADLDALLDSRAFTDTLGSLNYSDLEAVKTHVKEFVDAHPRFASTRPAPGVRDAAAGTSPGNTGSTAQQFSQFFNKHI